MSLSCFETSKERHQLIGGVRSADSEKRAREKGSSLAGVWFLYCISFLEIPNDVNALLFEIISQYYSLYMATGIMSK